MRESGIAKLLLCSPLIRFWSQFQTWICYFPIWGVTRLPLFCYFPIWSGLSQDCPCLGRDSYGLRDRALLFYFLFLSETSDSISNQRLQPFPQLLLQPPMLLKEPASFCSLLPPLSLVHPGLTHQSLKSIFYILLSPILTVRN